MANPIWKDYYVNLGTADSVQFRILVDDDVIYTGKAFKRPGKINNEIRINDICADYLKCSDLSLLSIDNRFLDANYPVFIVQILSDSSWVQVDSIRFYNDWSYDRSFNPNAKGLSCPVNGRVCNAMPLPYSVLSASELEVEIGYNGDYEYVYSHPDINSYPGCYLLKLSQYRIGSVLHCEDDNVDSGIDYNVVDFCGRYALYYINAYGGVDMLLIEGGYSESDLLSRHTRDLEYDNRDNRDRGRQNYVSEISKGLTLHTSWMSDDESSRMHHLLNSTEVYLFDVDTFEFSPVLLKNTTTEYKTYKSNGCKLVNYAIEIEYANDRIRR